ncbi:hypothetical protein [Rhizobium mongolense]|uniref:hypothetical protein n=1 Tax=Rhizobium mongolense TaxID=57676 RepID=UPI0034A2BC45
MERQRSASHQKTALTVLTGGYAAQIGRFRIERDLITVFEALYMAAADARRFCDYRRLDFLDEKDLPTSDWGAILPRG